MKTPKTVPESFFYHSFPRRFAEKPDLEINKGIEILTAIRDFGLVLTPEITEWQESLNNGTFDEPWRVIQKRSCFTELTTSEVPGHAEMFGRFCLEFEIQTLRELGGIPVIYLPHASDADRGLESQAAAIMARTGEIQVLLNRLSDLAETVQRSQDKGQPLVIENKGQQLTTRCSIGAAEDILDMLTLNSQPVEVLRNALRVLSAFFYPTEDLRHTGSLAYYRQREWRLVANMSKNGEEVNRDLTAQEVERLLQIDPEFFGKKEAYFTGEYRRVDQCRLYESLEGKPIIDHVRRVLVPRAAVARVSALVPGLEVGPIEDM